MLRRLSKMRNPTPVGCVFNFALYKAFFCAIPVDRGAIGLLELRNISKGAQNDPSNHDRNRANVGPLVTIHRADSDF